MPPLFTPKLANAIFSFFSLFILVGIVAILIGLTGLDIFLRIRDNKYLILGAGSACLVCLIGVLLVLSSRKLSTRSALQDIPKLYIPINPSDKVHRLIQNDLSRVANITLEAKPRIEDVPSVGWGRAGTQYENVHFQTAALQSIDILESTAMRVDSSLSRPAVCPPTRYIEALVTNGVIDAELASVYAQRFDEVRFAREEMREEEYVEFMKLFALVLRSVRH
ncbi:hypothetical protein HDV00_001119 [Rhizophlyctis rosea]|nr:hypothetical protein HDV00_001119 [Rhizophlyctis rosea]